MSPLKGGGRRFRPDYEETHELRTALFAAFATRRRYQHIVRQDLRPLWRRAAASTSDNRLFFELRHTAEEPDAAEAIKVYVKDVERVVTAVLCLTLRDSPVAWAGNYLHAHVEPRSGQGTPDPSVPHVPSAPRLRGFWYERAALDLQVSPREATVAAIGDNGMIVETERIQGNAGYGDAEWKRLADRAHELLDRRLAQMRISYEGNNLALAAGDASAPPVRFQHRNPARQHKLPDDMAILAAWLLGESTPDKATRDRLRDRIHPLAIDTPRSAKK